MVGFAISKNKVVIRLTEERWFHITESHDYMSGLSDYVLEAINEPEEIIEGDENELIAIKTFNNKYLVAVYREVKDKDGFVITAFLTSDIEKIRKNKQIKWKK